jgi:Uma2 family endonuclease
MATIEMPVVVETEVKKAEVKDERPARWLWTRARYHQAGELGLFHPGERVELLEGEVFYKVSPQSDPHASAIVLTADALRAALGQGFHVREEKPMVLSDLTEPEPDVVVVRGTARNTPNHPTPANAVLVIEVSFSTLTFDRTEKAAAYARSGIADYWILNLRARQLEVRRDPGPMNNGEHSYRSLQILLENGEVSPLATPDVVVRVADLLPSLPLSEEASNDEASGTSI